ncbi:MAG TPA: hypothetical protein VJR95_15420 [Rhodanobacter sp.]|nr:hypothetical protein [Rhodanobacter sp.]
MKHETLMLHGLFAICLLVCALVVGSMLAIAPLSVQFAAKADTTHALALANSSCAGGTHCPLPRG